MKTKFAFPSNGVYEPGMTLRDWFAGMALRAVIDQTIINDVGGADLKAIAFNSYLMADAMMKERENDSSIKN